MSLILDALRRAEQERQQGRAPGLDQLPTGPESTRRAVPWPTLAMSGLLVVGAVTLGLTLRHGEVQPSPAASQPEVRRPAAATVAAQASAAQPAQALEPAATKPASAHAKPALQGASDLNSMDDLLEPPEPVRAAAAPRPAPPPRTIAPVDLSRQAPAAAVNTQGPSQAPAVIATDSPSKPEGSPLLAAEDVLMSGPTVTPLRDMPPGYRADFPSLNVDVHVYNEAPQRRFVLLNLRRYREGQTLSEGPKLIEIQPDGIVFDFRGERVLMELAR